MSLLFPHVDAAWKYCVHKCLYQGNYLESRAGACRELLGETITITEPSQRMLRNPRRKASRAYASAETLWYLSRNPSVRMLLPFAPQYERFAESNGHAFGAYGARWTDAGTDRLLQALRLLQHDPNTRQAVVSMWRSSDLQHAAAKDRKDLPCTAFFQFFVRDGHLHMHTHMRSNDLWLGTPYDWFAFMTIQHLFALALDLELGHYTHMVGSMHIYDKNEQAALESLEDTRSSQIPPACTPGNLGSVMAYEALEPVSNWQAMWQSFIPLTGRNRNFMDDMISACSKKLNPNGEDTSVLLDDVMMEIP